MLQICRLENGVVVDGPFDLPRQIPSISVGALVRAAQSVNDLSPDDRLALMMADHPAAEIVATPYDSETEKPVGHNYVVSADRVVATVTVAPLSQSELGERTAQRTAETAGILDYELRRRLAAAVSAVVGRVIGSQEIQGSHQSGQPRGLTASKQENGQPRRPCQPRVDAGRDGTRGRAAGARSIGRCPGDQAR